MRAYFRSQIEAVVIDWLIVIFVKDNGLLL